MKLTKNEIKQIVEEYDLGKILKYKLILGGLVNHNYKLETTKGKYVIRILNKNTKDKIKELKNQFKIIKKLKEKKIPYKLTNPLQTKTKKEIIQIKNKTIWVYELIEGYNKDKPTKKEMKEIAKALGEFHKFVKGIKGTKRKNNNNKHIENLFRQMIKTKNKTEEDKLANEYKNFFWEIYQKTKNCAPNKNYLFAHQDFDSSNVIFQKGKIIGIIDFEDLEYVPRIIDVTVSIRDSCSTKGKLDSEKIKIFLEEYEKNVPLTKSEKEKIIPLIEYYNTYFFVWAYAEMKKQKQKRIQYMKEMITMTKDIEKRKIRI